MDTSRKHLRPKESAHHYERESVDVCRFNKLIIRGFVYLAFVRVETLDVIDKKRNVVCRVFTTSLGLYSLAQRLVLLPCCLVLKIKSKSWGRVILRAKFLQLASPLDIIN